MINKKKYIVIPVIIFTILTCFNIPVQAKDPNLDTVVEWSTDWFFETRLKAANSFIKEGMENENQKFNQANTKVLSNVIYNVLFILGIIIAFIVGGILGIKFITSGLDGKAEVKNMMIPYIVGLVVIFGSFTIWKIVLTILQD